MSVGFDTAGIRSMIDGDDGWPSCILKLYIVFTAVA